MAQQRHLDRAACVACDTIRSRRRRRCSFCKRDTPLRDLVVGDTFQDRRQPGHQDAAPGGPSHRSPPSSELAVPPGDPSTARFQTAPSRTSFSQNETSSCLPSFAELPQRLSFAACSLATDWAVLDRACCWLRCQKALTEIQN